VWFDLEGIIIPDVLGNVFFCLVFVLVQVICFQSVVEKPYSSIFVLGWVVGVLWDCSFCESGFPVYGYLPVHRGLVDSDFQVVYYFIVSLCFCHKF